MATGCGWALPRLDGIASIHTIRQGERAAARVAWAFVEAGVAEAEDWPRADGDVFRFLEQALDRWIDEHGGKQIREVFQLHLTLSASLDRYTDLSDPVKSTLYLTLEPESAGYVVLGSTLRALEPVHRRLPATFVHMLIGAVNSWLRVYDWRDAMYRVEQLREWHEMDPEENGQFELADIESSIPACMRRRPLTRRATERLCPTMRSREIRDIVRRVLELDALAETTRRPAVTDQTAELLQDCGDPLPALLAVFEKHDAVEGQFDEESQGMLEVAPEPNAIVAIHATEPTTVQTGFTNLAAGCAILERTARLLKALPEALATD